MVGESAQSCPSCVPQGLSASFHSLLGGSDQTASLRGSVFGTCWEDGCQDTGYKMQQEQASAFKSFAGSIAKVFNTCLVMKEVVQADIMIRQHQQPGVTTGVGDPVAGMRCCVLYAPSL